MKFTKLDAYPIWPNKIKVIWDINNKELNGKYKFTVDIDKGNGVFEPEILASYNIYEVILNCIPILSTEYRQAIKIKVTCYPPIQNKNREIVPFEQIINLYRHFDRENFLKVQEIVRKETLRLEKKVGMPVHIYKRVLSNEDCTVCVHPLTKTVTDSRCSVCLGTKKKQGYYFSGETFCEFVENPVLKQITDISTSENKTARIRLTNKILVSKNDLIIDVLNNNRWKLSSEPAIIRHRTFPITQESEVFMVSPKDILNTIEVNYNAKNC